MITWSKRRRLLALAAGCAALASAAGPLMAQARKSTYASSTEGVMARSTVKGDPVAVCGHFGYVVNSYSATASVIDLSKNAFVKNLPLGEKPINPTFTRDWSKLYVANSGGGTLTIIDAKTVQVIGTIPAGGPHPSGLRFLPDGKHLVISFLGETVQDQGSLGIMDLATGKLVKSIPVQAQSERFDITPDGKRAYVGNLGSQTISAVDLESGAVIATIPSPERLPFNVVVSPNGKKVFVGNTMGSTLLEIDTATNQIVQVIKVPTGPNGLTFTPDGDNVLMTNVYAGRISSYNLSMKAVNEGKSVGLLPGFVRLAPDGLKGIFVRPYGRQASIFDGTTWDVIANIETGIGPSAVAICGNP
jgi:YVTN family beta-propeller protein